VDTICSGIHDDSNRSHPLPIILHTRRNREETVPLVGEAEGRVVDVDPVTVAIEEVAVLVIATAAAAAADEEDKDDEGYIDGYAMVAFGFEEGGPSLRVVVVVDAPTPTSPITMGLLSRVATMKA
jgi:hypothetical protein